MTDLPRVIALRGHNTNVWDMRPLELISDRYRITTAVTGSVVHQLAGLELDQVAVRTPRDVLPSGRLGGAAAYALGERYIDLERVLKGADIVHAAEIGTWFTAQAAQLKQKLGFKLVVTAWETLPWRDTFRWPRERKYRQQAIDQIDLCLAATERAARCLVLEGVPEDRIVVVSPGVDIDRFAKAQAQHPEPNSHTILSAGRLVWEKGHQDVLRAMALIMRERNDVELLITGSGPEGKKLERYAADLNVPVRFQATIPYDEMPALYGRCSALVLASIPVRAWEEQFGMVLVEARSAGLPVLASTAGAIPEVLGDEGTLFAPGDWPGIARALLEGPLSGPPNTRIPASTEWLGQYRAEVAAERTAAAYQRVLAAPHIV